MKEVLNYYKYSSRQSAVTLALFLVIPVCIPYIVYAVTNIFAANNDEVKIENFIV